MRNNKRLITIILTIVGLLAIPLITMQFTTEMNWGLEDFVIMGILLSVLGFGYELAARSTTNTKCKMAVGLALVSSFILIWINLAVGIIGSEDNPANALYGLVILVGMAGAVIARFKSTGMKYTMFAMAFAQVLVPVVAFILYQPEVASQEDMAGLIGVFVLSSLFALLFAGSAVLFGQVEIAPHSDKTV